MESSTLLSNTINLELHGIFAQHDLFLFIRAPRAIIAFSITFTTFTEYILMIHPMSCQLMIEFIALLNDKIMCCVIVSISKLFLC